MLNLFIDLTQTDLVIALIPFFVVVGAAGLSLVFWYFWC